MKKFSKGQVNYRKHQRKVMSRQCRRDAKRDIAQQPQERHLCVDKEGSHFNAVYPSRCVECGKLF